MSFSNRVPTTIVELCCTNSVADVSTFLEEVFLLIQLWPPVRFFFLLNIAVILAFFVVVVDWLCGLRIQF